MKESISIEQLCHGYPGTVSLIDSFLDLIPLQTHMLFVVEMATYLSYVKNLRFADKPDYQYLTKMFDDLSTKKGFTNIPSFEWLNTRKDIISSTSRTAGVASPYESVCVFLLTWHLVSANTFFFTSYLDKFHPF